MVGRTPDSNSRPVGWCHDGRPTNKTCADLWLCRMAAPWRARACHAHDHGDARGWRVPPEDPHFVGRISCAWRSRVVRLVNTATGSRIRPVAVHPLYAAIAFPNG